MKIIDRLRKRPADTNVTSTGSSSHDEQEPPIAGYDRLGDKELSRRLHELSQVELAAVEEYERSHGQRAVVLDKLRFMRTREPLEGYDELTPAEISRQLDGADAATVKGVRDYERKFAGRREVLDETARVLPQAAESAGETRSREEKEARVSASIRAKG